MMCWNYRNKQHFPNKIDKFFYTNCQTWSIETFFLHTILLVNLSKYTNGDFKIKVKKEGLEGNKILVGKILCFNNLNVKISKQKAG